ncbi:MAG: hypothetical protein E7322_08345 [Clostridiales bacterium]|nr:hypothetical protein [Clostridiales bacterium]
MKSNCFLRQIMIAVLIVALFAIGLFAVLFLTKDAPIIVLSAHDFGGATAVVYSSEGDSTGANCPVYSLESGKYLALFDGSCDLAHDGLRREVKINRSGDECEIIHRGKKESRPVEKALSDETKYEFFGGEISFYPFEEEWISVIRLMNSAEHEKFECVRFGNIEMTAQEYRNAYPEEADGLRWDEESGVYVDEVGEIHKIRYGFAYEIPVLDWTKEKDAYVSFYLTDADYTSLMESKVFELLDSKGGSINALFWEGK